jgi:hypothetical protein
VEEGRAGERSKSVLTALLLVIMVMPAIRRKLDIALHEADAGHP